MRLHKCEQRPAMQEIAQVSEMVATRLPISDELKCNKDSEPTVYGE